MYEKKKKTAMMLQVQNKKKRMLGRKTNANFCLEYVRTGGKVVFSEASGIVGKITESVQNGDMQAAHAYKYSECCPYSLN